MDSDVAYTYDDDTVPGSGDVTDCRTSAAMSSGTSRRTMGRLSKVVDQSGTRWFNYDTHGRVVATWDMRDMRDELDATCARVTTSEYDSVGRVISMRLPTGRRLAYGYTGPNPSAPRTVTAYRVAADKTACESGSGGWTWNDTTNECTRTIATDVAFGGGALRRWKVSLGRVLVAEAMLDGAPRRSGTENSNPASQFVRTVTETDALGNPKTIAGPAGGDDPDTLTYAPWFHWLESSTQDDPPGLHEYEVKPTLLGDRTAMTWSPDWAVDPVTQAVTYASGSSRMTSWEVNVPSAWGVGTEGMRAVNMVYTAGGAISEFDNEGKSGGAWSAPTPIIVTYDGAERMASWDGNTFAYDFRNLRTQKVADFNDVTTDFWYDDAGQLLAELGCSSPCTVTGPRPLKEYVWLGGRPIAFIDSTLDDTGEILDDGEDALASGDDVAVFDVATGLLGEPIAVTSSSSFSYVWSEEHTPFWEFGQFNGPTNLRFPGQYADEETGLFYNWHRYYWPMVGRYVSADPLIPRGLQLQPYAYALQQPAKYSDRTGLDIWIEGPSGDEPFLHQSINIGDPAGNYVSVSFAINGGGSVYPERPQDQGGEIGRYMPTTPEQDAAAIKYLEDTRKKDNERSYSPNNTCRDYSQRKFDELKNRLGLEEAFPPVRSKGRAEPLPPLIWAPVIFTTTSSSR